MVDPMRLIALLLLVGATSAFAQQADPTRPPAAWLAPVDDSARGATGEQAVALGGRVGGATLIRLNEREAVLQGADGVTHLYLTPDVEKQMIETPKPRKSGTSVPVKGLP